METTFTSQNHLKKYPYVALYDTSLKLASPSSSYDFDGNVEMKSSTKQWGGSTPFSVNQNNCSRIIYLEITNHFDVYEIAFTEVNNINAAVRKGNTNISLKNYLSNAKKKRII